MSSLSGRMEAVAGADDTDHCTGDVQQNSRRRRILDELTRAEARDGLYDLEPPQDGEE